MHHNMNKTSLHKKRTRRTEITLRSFPSSFLLNSVTILVSPSMTSETGGRRSKMKHELKVMLVLQTTYNLYYLALLYSCYRQNCTVYHQGSTRLRISGLTLLW